MRSRTTRRQVRAERLLNRARYLLIVFSGGWSILALTVLLGSNGRNRSRRRRRLTKGDSIICAHAICVTSMWDAIRSPVNHWRPSENDRRSTDRRNRYARQTDGQPYAARSRDLERDRDVTRRRSDARDNSSFGQLRFAPPYGYDATLDAPSANHNGPRTSAVRDTARAIARSPCKSTIVFTCFDGEEQGLFRSRTAGRTSRQISTTASWARRSVKTTKRCPQGSVSLERCYPTARGCCPQVTRCRADVSQGDHEVAEHDPDPVRLDAPSVCHYRKRDYAAAYQTTDTPRS